MSEIVDLKRIKTTLFQAAKLQFYFVDPKLF